MAPIFNQIPVNNSSISLKPLTFSVGLVPPDNPKLPKWMDFSAFYISGHLGFGGGYSKSLGEKGSFGLSFASLGLGISANVEIVSFYFGAKLNDYVSIDGKVYVGWGISFDFSNGVKIGIAAGVGFEIAINF